MQAHVFKNIWLIGCFGMMLAIRNAIAAAEQNVITNIAEIRALSREGAAKGYPVQILGVVTWQSSGGKAFVVDDGTQAIYVDMASSKKLSAWTGADLPVKESESGAIVKIDGITDAGGYAPIILCRSLKRIGSGNQKPRHLELEQLLSGSADGLWVEVEGVVQSVVDDQGHDDWNAAGIRVLVAGQICRVGFAHGLGINATNLVDARVRVRGALASVYNLRSEVAGLKLSANGQEDIDVLLPPPRDPFLGPKVALNKLRLFSPNSAVAFHRKVTQGVVIFAIPGQFFIIEDDNSGVRVESSSAIVNLGEIVEVAGFLDPSRSVASLNGAIVRKIGSALPKPLSTTAEQILHPPMVGLGSEIAKSDLNYRLVKIRGKLFQFNHAANNGLNELRIVSDGHIVIAYLPESSFTESTLGAMSQSSNQLKLPANPTMTPIDLASVPWVDGAEVELTGACELDFAEHSAIESTFSINDFHLWLRSPQDVQVICAPPWWTTKRLGMALSLAILVVLICVVWGTTLQNQLRVRTDRLEKVMTAHRNVELEFSSARRERLRLAADLHDGLKQLLAAASFRLEAAAGHLAESPSVASKHLASAQATLIRTQEELQECMQGLHTLEDGPPELAELLRHLVSTTDYWPKNVIVIEKKGNSRVLPRDVAGSLLLLFQEAVTNSLQHGYAGRVNVLVDYSDDELTLQIVDDGIGFDPASVGGVSSGHFGIDGMRRRIVWLGGTFKIGRHKGGGTDVSACIQWSAIRQSDKTEPTQTTPNKNS